MKKVYIVGCTGTGKTSLYKTLNAAAADEFLLDLAGASYFVPHKKIKMGSEWVELFDFPGIDDFNENSERKQIYSQMLLDPNFVLIFVMNQNKTRAQIELLLQLFQTGAPILLWVNLNEDLSSFPSIQWKSLAKKFNLRMIESSLIQEVNLSKLYKIWPLLTTGRNRRTDLEPYSLEILKEIQPDSKSLPSAQKSFWTFSAWLMSVLSIFCLVQFINLKFIVPYLEQILIGKYLYAFFEFILSEINTPTLLQDILIGNTGLLNMVLGYVIGFMLPVMLVFYLGIIFLVESHLMDSIKSYGFSLLQKTRFSQAAWQTFFTGLGCKLPALIRIRSIPNPTRQKAALFFLLCGIPCFSQSLVLGNVLLSLNFFYFVSFLGFMLIQAFMGIWVFSARTESPVIYEMLEPHKIGWPDPTQLFSRVFSQCLALLRLLIPYFVLASLSLSLIELSPIHLWLKGFFGPLLQSFFDLPPDTFEVFFLGFFRRELGAVWLYQLTNQGTLSILQAVHCLLLICFFYPCLASLLLSAKLLGKRVTFGMGILVLLYAALLIRGVNFIFNL